MWNLLTPLAEETGQDLDVLRNRFWGRVPDRESWPPDRLMSQWLPHRIYAAVEAGFFDAVGNPAAAADWVRRVVALGADEKDKGTELIMVLGRRWAITPEAVASVLPWEGRKRNTLKQIVILDAEPGILRTRTLYRGEGGRPYTVEPADDIGSNAFFAAARVAAPAALVSEPAEVLHEVLEVEFGDFVEFCRPWAPGLHYSVVDGAAYVNGRRVAEPVRLGPDDAGFATRVCGAHEPSTVLGMRLLEDLVLTDAGDRPWRAANAGAVFSRRAGCSIVRYEYEPVSHLLDKLLVGAGRLMCRLPILRRAVTQRAIDRVQTVAAEAGAGVVEAGLQQDLDVARSVAAIYPDRTSYDSALRGDYLVHDDAAVCVCTDVSGFGAYTENTAPERVVQAVNALLSSAVDVLNHHGFDLVSFTGDGGLFAASAELGRSRGRSLEKRTEAGVRAARQLVRVAEDTLKVTVRVGVCAGPVTFFALKSSAAHPAVLPQAVGLGLNRATRVEAGLKAQQVARGHSVAGVARSTFGDAEPDLAALGLAPIEGVVQVKEARLSLLEILPGEATGRAEEQLEAHVKVALQAAIGDPVQ